MVNEIILVLYNIIPLWQEAVDGLMYYFYCRRILLNTARSGYGTSYESSFNAQFVFSWVINCTRPSLSTR